FPLVSCGIIQVGRVDPVISYGAVSNHVHKIAGASNIGLSSTYASLQQSECTSCTIQADKSAYWSPALYYQHADGTYEEVPNSGMAVYYLGRGADPHGNKTANPFPPGLKMLSGSNSARTQDLTTKTWGNSSYPSRLLSEAVSMVCINYTPGAGSQTVNMTNMNCPDGFRAQIQMQTCWDGKNLYLPDQSHMAHLSQIDNGICPPTHPVLLPHLFYEMYYTVTSFVGGDGQFVFANGDTTGFGFHGDFINGWDIPTLTQAIDQCLIKNVNGVVEDCPAFNASNNPNSPQICPERSPIFPCEPVKGRISKLPGCITPVGYGQVVTSADITCPGGNVAACNATTANPPLPWTGDATYTSLGCYTEATSGRALTGNSTSNSTNMTASVCKAFCYGYKYFGVEYGQECYCGNTINAGAVLTNSSRCNMNCASNQWELCGGRSALNMFQMNATLYKAPAVPTVWAGDSLFSSIGCYTEATSGRALSAKSYTDSKNMTAQSCEAYCGTAYAYFGVEWSQECYCGNQLNAGSVPVSASNCTKICTGDKLQYCGGSSRLNVFKRLATPVSSATTAKSTSASVGLWNYQGCFTEATSGRALSSKQLYGSSSSATGNMNLDTCASFCFDNGYAMFGVEYGQQCYCGNSLNAGSVWATNQDDCSTKCPGNSTQFCGAGKRLNVYSVVPGSGFDPATGFSLKYAEPLNVGNASVGIWNYKGCYTEATTGRALASAKLTGSSSTFGMTIETCVKYCYGKGYAMSGVEYGQQCYCGNSLATTSVWATNQNECSTKCPGNSSQYCGGGSRLNLYALSSTAT
ncbi:WSC-domain-containing protein, partial [Coniochaeta ligniaria NRRL 30616]